MSPMTHEVAAPNADGQAAILRDLASDLAATDDLPELLMRFLVPLLRMAGADAGAVRAISQDGGQLHLVSSVGLTGPALRGAWTAHRDCGACGSAATTNAATWANGQAGCPQLGVSGHTSGDFQRMLAVPLKHRDQVLGVYNLFFLRAQGPGPEVLAVLESVGSVLGLALNNARLEQAHLRAAVTHERQSMAAEVHDSIAQTLAFVKLRMPLLHAAIIEHDEPAALRYSADVRRAVTDAHAAVRELLTNFRAPVDPLGLRHALQSGIDEFESATGIELVFEDRAPGLGLSSSQETQLFRIVQEALTNIAKHARAQRSWLTIVRRDDGVEIVVEDDGQGFGPTGAADAGESHYGIDIMRQRTAKLGGEIEFGPRGGGGTRVRLWVPLGAQGGAAR